MSNNVLVVGAVNVDLVVTADKLPGPGETVVGPAVATHGGGKGANAAVAAARAGANVRYCGAVGADDHGAGALRELGSEGIDITDVAVLPYVSTGTALIVVDPSGENQIAVGAGANAAVTPKAVTAAVKRAADWADCVLVSTEIASEAIASAVNTAADHDLLCVLNTAPVRTSLRELLRFRPVVTPNESELIELAAALGVPNTSSLSTEEMASSLSTRTGASVVVTLGSRGVLVVTSGTGDPVSVPAPRVQVQDTTGAGDTFNGVFAAALANGYSIAAAAERGVAGASLAVGWVGARDGMPHVDAIERALHEGAR
ncbi:ribokinase [Gordonia terrae]|uniref:Ribokinase n=1 Tax=Gordonia terrae TaxID=2055 RepID=A0A2I1R4R7_9ACTN|nr:PfkB family carbohydrate kinase [Gordonia terrae]PKZ64126.1 ribokinase [Gordonia terrae]